MSPIVPSSAIPFASAIFRFEEKVFQDALEESISPIKSEALLAIAENACCPIPVSTPKPRPLLILLPRLSAVPIAFLRADENPLSVAERIALTEKLSDKISLSFLQ